VTLVLLGLGALSASLALLMAHVHLLGVAHVLAATAATCGLAAFVTVAGSTVRRARRLPSDSTIRRAERVPSGSIIRRAKQLPCESTIGRARRLPAEERRP
jgi:hypothetical protein